MNGNEILAIKVKIAGREFPLRVAQKDEGEVRAAAQLITETFEKYRDKFPNEDYANVLAKASLTVLVGQNKKAQAQDTSDLMDKLYQLEQGMEDFIEEELK